MTAHGRELDECTAFRVVIKSVSAPEQSFNPQKICRLFVE